jgi:Fe-S oxidoreductase
MFSEMSGFLSDHGIKNVVVACPNCHKVFFDYGRAFSVKTVYEIIDQNGFRRGKVLSGTVTVHDPCPMRFVRSTQDAVRNLILSFGLEIAEMPHYRENTLCCGEGGAVEHINREMSETYQLKRINEAGGKKMVTYCAGCAGRLGKVAPVSHLLDLICDPVKTIQGKVHAALPPFTSVNRLLFKRKMKRTIPAAVMRERMFDGSIG